MLCRLHSHLTTGAALLHDALVFYLMHRHKTQPHHPWFVPSTTGLCPYRSTCLLYHWSHTITHSAARAVCMFQAAPKFTNMLVGVHGSWLIYTGCVTLSHILTNVLACCMGTVLINANWPPEGPVQWLTATSGPSRTSYY